MVAFKIIKPFLIIGFRIFSVIIFLLTITGAYGGKIDPDFFTFPSILCLVFPYLAIATIIIAIIWAFLRKFIFCGIGVVTILLCSGPFTLAVPLGHSHSASENAETFKIISWNVIHTRDVRQSGYQGNRAVEFMIHSDADIITLAEMKNIDLELKEANTPQSLIDRLYSIYPYRVGLDKTDIKLLSKYPAERLERILNDDAGNCRFDFFRIHFPGQRQVVVGMVHLFSFGLSENERNVVTEINSLSTVKNSMNEFKGPIRHKMQEAFIRRAENATRLREVIDDIGDEIPLIICGDFNDVPASC